MKREASDQVGEDPLYSSPYGNGILLRTDTTTYQKMCQHEARARDKILEQNRFFGTKPSIVHVIS